MRILPRAIAITALSLLSAQAQVSLQYSGTDWGSGVPVGTSTTTITAMDGATTLWTMDVQHNSSVARTMFSKFEAGTSSFNYAGSQENINGAGLFAVGSNNEANRGTLAQSTRTSDLFSFTITKPSVASGGNFTQVITYTIGTPTASGTTITANYALTNNSGSAVQAFSAFEAKTLFNAGVSGDSFDYVTGYELAGGDPSYHIDRPHEKTSDQSAGLYQMTENIDKTVNTGVASGDGGWTTTVLNNAETIGADMMAGLEFAVTTDVDNYYPGTTAGNFGSATIVSTGVLYNDGLFGEFNPREWEEGPTRPSPYPSVDPGATVTAEVIMGINIGSSVPEPSTYALMLGAGVMGFVLLRKRSKK